ncbi:hypothetical protein A9Q84_13030 [Halobacteriovorax marinus]|uniref:DUF4423 domain-containing protein n=1 Tax=Halobacteriovorax marinus TaxID=97084 RepID=A0A1Y5F8P3_9BACT|nr:hypothetical protein A9Q84_13030 [Halobacteriovorax marinus]
MNENIFEYSDYKHYLNEKISQLPSKGRGVRLQMAKFLGCQTAYISQVLNQHVNFSLEQAVKVNQFFNHSKDEGKFFVLLVQLERAGTSELENFLISEMEEIIERRSNLKERLNIKDSLDDDNQHIYYSVWYYAAIHIMLSIPEFQKAKAISEHLRLPLTQVQEVIEFLCTTGLAIERAGFYEIGKTQIHLSKESIQIRRHHTNWRNQAIASIDKNKEEDMHYSNVLSMSDEDVPRIKEILIKSIEECRKVIRVSNEERLQVLSLDFFGIK